jgi:hypothetical protein
VSSKNDDFDEQSTLLVKTLELLKGQNLLHIYRDTGIPYYWLKTVASGKTKSPSVNRIQYLYEHLTGTKLNF